MKICVLNGSPKGNESVTMQYVRFLELANPGHTFTTENIGQRIAAIEAHEEEFKKVIAAIESADAILFATPVYYMLVPAQFKQFIELLFSHNAGSAFFGKYAASLTTSIHFFDHTANAYLHAIAEDLGMRWTGSFMAKMDDLLEVKHQENLVRFGQDFLDTAQRHPAIRRTYPPIVSNPAEYRSAGVPMPLDCGGKKVLILTDAAPGSNLEKMTLRLASRFGKSASLVPVDDAEMNGGCLGCCRCAFDNTCVYTDGFSEFWKETVLPADIIILAGTVKDRYLSAAFKQVFDRSFFMGHVPAFPGKQVAFLIEGPVAQCSTLQEIMRAYPSLQGANFAGVVSDEAGIAMAIDEQIDALAARCLRLSDSGYVAPGGFPAVAGHKIFRDDIWGEMRAVFRADHAYYKKHGLYDFPHNDLRQRINTTLFSLFLSFPKVRDVAKKEMKQRMLQPFEKVLADSPVLKRQKKEG
jgi:multimeric flavodoxin WrbA